MNLEGVSAVGANGELFRSVPMPDSSAIGILTEIPHDHGRKFYTSGNTFDKIALYAAGRLHYKVSEGKVVF